jgi:nucleotide-binding universal stress UspA family protein
MQSERVFEKILLPIDGSTPSLVAQELTVFLAKKFNSKVTVLHVVSHEFMSPHAKRFFAETDRHAPLGIIGATPAPPYVDTSPTAPDSPYSEEAANEIMELYHQKGQEALDNAVALFKGEGLNVDQNLIEHADPAETIIYEAERGNFGLIVMANSAEEKEETHLGSVAKKVSLHSNVSVLIVKGKRQISKILVPIDGSPHGEKALQHAAFLAKETGSKMTLLYVQESGIFNLRPAMTKEIGNCILRRATEQIKGLTADQMLESGDPAKVIVQTANKGNYDIIVMGNRGLGAVGRFLLGSVSDHVSHYANHSVLIVK